MRARLKICDKTDSYEFLKKNSKKAIEDAEFDCEQRLSLTSEEISKLPKRESQSERNGVNYLLKAKATLSVNESVP